jgi:hypothetical protein
LRTDTPDDERRCEEVAQLFLEGKKGDELAAAVRTLHRLRTDTPDVDFSYPYRQSSPVPLPDHRYNGIALPAPPFLTSSRSGPLMDDVTMARMIMGQRRASSAQPFSFRSWTVPPTQPLKPTILGLQTSEYGGLNSTPPIFDNLLLDYSKSELPCVLYMYQLSWLDLMYSRSIGRLHCRKFIK